MPLALSLCPKAAAHNKHTQSQQSLQMSSSPLSNIAHDTQSSHLCLHGGGQKPKPKCWFGHGPISTPEHGPADLHSHLVSATSNSLSLAPERCTREEPGPHSRILGLTGDWSGRYSPGREPTLLEGLRKCASKELGVIPITASLGGTSPFKKSSSSSSTSSCTDNTGEQQDREGSLNNSRIPFRGTDATPVSMVTRYRPLTRWLRHLAQLSQTRPSVDRRTSRSTAPPPHVNKRENQKQLSDN